MAPQNIYDPPFIQFRNSKSIEYRIYLMHYLSSISGINFRLAQRAFLICFRRDHG